MDKFLEIYNIPILHQEEAHSLNTPITAGGNEAVIKNHPAHKSLELVGFTG